MDSLTTSARNMPKMSIPTLEAQKRGRQYYVISEEGQYHYFDIKLEEGSLTQPVMRFDKSPPVLIEGIAVIGRKFYRVPIKDLMRGIIRKSRELNLANRVTGNGSTRNSSNTADPTGLSDKGEGPDLSRNSADNPVQNTDQQRAGETSWVEDIQDANVAWDGQVESLLSFISAKEGSGWEVESPAQSRHPDESSPAPNSQVDSGEG